MGERVAGGAVRAREWGDGGGDLDDDGGYRGGAVHDCVVGGGGFDVGGFSFFFPLIGGEGGFGSRLLLFSNAYGQKSCRGGYLEVILTD